MIQYLLDTHALLWYVTGDPQLSAAARALLADRKNQCFVSHGSAWEIAIKVGLGKLQFGMRYDELFPIALNANGFKLLSPNIEHYQKLLQLPMKHRVHLIDFWLRRLGLSN